MHLFVTCRFSYFFPRFLVLGRTNLVLGSVFWYWGENLVAPGVKRVQMKDPAHRAQPGPKKKKSGEISMEKEVSNHDFFLSKTPMTVNCSIPRSLWKQEYHGIFLFSENLYSLLFLCFSSVASATAVADISTFPWIRYQHYTMLVSYQMHMGWIGIMWEITLEICRVQSTFYWHCTIKTDFSYIKDTDDREL